MYDTSPNTEYSYSKGYTQSTSFNSDIQSTLRVNFIRKVFAIVAAQLTMTFLFCMASMTSPAFASFQRSSPGLLGLSAIATIILMLVLTFSTTMSRTVPTNYILLAAFTLCESYTVSFITSVYDPATVTLALFLTAVVVIGLALYAFTSKTEVGYFRGLILNITLAMLGMGLISFFSRLFVGIALFHKLIFACSAALAGLYLIYDIKMIVGQGRRKIDLDDYIKGALFLYLDIIRIFLKILEFLNAM
eukprot:CAMPEP_0114589704 /NCGR_PEP_ID=MMETSP0125-20121206/12099_1 /TAXON_ID=485358 ORGANISM="Aristerostoma sp., Strain ATCC 50986" /NCGR_SAMPLE_ID=MMETSP0125 /ASSEMBLY_ACC=CAM_ASM_000245 /LENGTH=246 /DNA_ID=CAMNT_0001786751 /DNA_START=73 /DNA_END=813 /DNA_ORIENTATION=+